MAQAMVNFRMDADLKKSMEQTCQEMGMSMTTAFTIFATKVSREKRSPHMAHSYSAGCGRGDSTKPYMAAIS